MNKSKATLIFALSGAAMLHAGSALAAAGASMADNPAVEMIEGAFPPELASSGSLFEEVPAIPAVEPVTFEIRRGEKLREAMERWTEDSVYTLVWQPAPEDGDIRFASDMEFSGDFAEATEAFFDVVRAQTKFDGKLHSNNVLRVFVANAKR